MLQPVLSNNESFGHDLSVFYNQGTEKYEVYLGLALLESIPTDPSSLVHKMLMGRLYNAGTAVTYIAKTFRHDPRSIKRWARGLTCADANEFVRAFADRGYQRKVTQEVYRYIELLYEQKEHLGHNYRQQIIVCVEKVFDLTISSSTASDLFRACKSVKSSNLAPTHAADINVDKSELWASTGQDDAPLSTNRKQTVQHTPIIAFQNDSSYDLSNWRLIKHAGLALFSAFLYSYSDFERQILCQLLSGARNIEQSKNICHKSLEFFCTSIKSSRREQRQKLDEMASDEKRLIDLYHLNSSLLSDGPNHGEIFYFDPHTKEYTGELKVLKGWCGRKHGISKVLNLDCFHTRSGRPCYISHHSPYYDMRVRFFMNLNSFNQLFSEDKRQGRTFVIDRAIFGLDTLRLFQNDYLITWEKGYKRDGWDSSGNSETIEFKRYRHKNSHEHRRFYTFATQENSWKKDPSYRRIIVRAKNYQGKELELSILCNNPKMDIKDIVWTIFNRWLQENDFKNLDENYGINQLDKRDSRKFKDNIKKFTDLPIDCPEYKELKALLISKEAQLGKTLVAIRKLKKRLQEAEIAKLKLIKQVEKRIQSLKQKPCLSTDSKQLIKGIDVFTSKHKRDENNLHKQEQKAIELDEQCLEISSNLNDAIRKESKLLFLANNDYQMLETKRKAILDALRVNAANLFHALHWKFRKIINNFRDDHVNLRMLTHAQGMIQKNGRIYCVRLWIGASIQKHIIYKMQLFVDSIAQDINRINDPNGKQIKFQIISGPI
jgi:hypothetical protein